MHVVVKSPGYVLLDQYPRMSINDLLLALQLRKQQYFEEIANFMSSYSKSKIKIKIHFWSKMESKYIDPYKIQLMIIKMFFFVTFESFSNPVTSFINGSLPNVGYSTIKESIIFLQNVSKYHFLLHFTAHI